MTEKLSEERLKKICQLIMNPRPGSKVATALEAGVDLMLMFEQLKKTPQERIEYMQNAMRKLEKSERQAEKNGKRKDN